MRLLYLIFIKPIETVLSFLFSTYVSFTGSYGISIILLSLSVTMIMFPLYYIAEVWKRKEQAVEKRMHHRLTYIKRSYTGQKRYCMIKATHRLEGYTAASSFRTSFGLLIQIPFFFAAYHLLSHYEAYRGVSWLFIKDFALPDGLLWGLNLLPVLMTVINIVSSSIYMKGSRPKDIVELYIMAGVFLLLLYASPAALVLYWTMNNIFSIGKSLIFLRLFPHEKYVPDPEDKTFSDYIQGIREAIRPCLNAGFWLFMVMALLFAIQCRVLKFYKEHFVYIYAVTALLAAASLLVLAVISLRRWKQSRPTLADMLKVLTAAFFFALVPAIGFYFKLQGAEGSILKKIIFVSAIAADILLFICLKYIIRYYIPEDKELLQDKKEKVSLYWWCAAFLGLAVTLIWPLWVYLSAPEETGTGLSSIISANIPVLIIWLLVAFIVFKLSKPETRTKQAEALLFLSALAICYHYILPGNYGELDKTLLHFAYKLDNRSLFLFAGDLAVIAIIFLAARVLSHKYAAQSRNMIALVLCCMIGITGVKVKNYLFSGSVHENAEAKIAQLPENNSLVNGYTKNGKNILLFISDMFTAGYMDTILEECPKLKEKFTGFTWYRNSVSPSWQTVCAMPSIFAGDEFLPIVLSDMPGTGYKKIERSAQIMFDQFKKEGYSVAVVNGHAAQIAPKLLSTVDHTDGIVYGKVWQEKYYKEKNRNTIIKQGHLFIMLSLFQNAPYFLKPVIYNESNWFIFSRKAIFWAVEKHVFPNYGYMKLLPEICNTDMKKNTFKYIHNALTHGPFGIKDDGSLIRPGEFPDEEKKSFYSGRGAYNSQREFLKLFDEWCDWMKKEGIYDNTYIILISDHGNNYPDYNPLTDDKIANSFNSLFMIKEFGAKGKMKINNDILISSHDAEKFMKNALYGTPVVIPKERKIQAVHYDNSDKFLDTGIIDIINAYDVEGWVYDPKNWKVIK